MSEILTLGLGNYGVLTAAHWANSTSKFDSEQRIIYSESSRRGAALRLFLLDEAQPSRVAKEVPLNTAPEELGRVPHHVKLRDDTEDGDADEEDQDEDELDFGWTWRTAKRHPRDELSAADREAEARHVDPSSEQAQPDAEDARVEVDDDDLLDEINGPPPQRLVPWWKYITAPTSRSTLVTQIHFDDPMGASLGHSFGFGYHQRWGGDMLTRAAGTLVGLDTYSDRLRRGIEDCDSAQGLQLFVDADSSYGGLACGLLQYLSEEFDDIRATVAHAIFPAVEFPASGDFVKKRRQEVLLNRALATAYLSQTAALYTPYEINSWSLPHLNKAFTIDDDVATSSIVAAASDTALYGARQRGTPQFRRLGETCALLRPGRAMSIVGVAHALPFPVPTPEVAPLRRGSTLDKSEVCLWSAFEASPLLKREPWRPLSFAFNQDVEVCQTSAGRIDAHYVAIRGTANLRDVRYPREEAMLRYAYPLRQLERFACSLFDEEYPVSSSFPVDRLFGAPRVSRLGPHGPMTAPAPAAVAVERDLTSFCAGTHLVNTTQAGGYLKQVCEGFDSTRYDREKLHQGYGFEKDEWAEVGETLHPLRDAYDRDGGLSDGDDGDDFE